MELLMLRYILEVEDDIRLVKLYGNGWYPNFDKYRTFIHKQEKNNENFSKTIKSFNLVRKNDVLYETVFSKTISNVSSFFDNEKCLYLSGYGNVHYDKSLIPVSSNGIYISNGVFEDTIETCISMKGKGNFIVGVCDSPESVFYKENKEKLEELKKKLLENSMSFKTYKHNNHRDKCYIISYRG